MLEVSEFKPETSVKKSFGLLVNLEVYVLLMTVIRYWCQKAQLGVAQITASY